ncbi:MAG: hypothetical protein J6D03_11410, partial [Clostridia bacterium]|nr:hypothetical protein [Clostridia bacterium]
PSNNDYYAYNDIINGYYRLSVEETSQIKKLTLIYRAFLNWNDYLEYMKAMRSIGLDNPEYKDKLNSIANELGIVYNCEVTYDFIENTIYYKYPEYNMGNLTDWYGTDEDGKIIENGIGPRTTFKWNYESKPILDPDTGEVIGEEIVADNTKYENLNYIIKENNQHMHYRLDRYVSTNAVFSYIRSNSTFSTFDLVLRDEIGHKIIENGYLGMSIHLIGELLNGSKFEKIKYAEPAIRNVEEEDKGDYCPFSELCNDCCANKCKYRRPTPVDRPKDDDGHYILADSFDRSIEQLEPKGEIDTNKTYSNIVKNSIESLIDKYRESPVIVDNTKYLNRIHMYHLYNENGDMIRYVDDSTYPDIILDSMNCHKKNMTYMNHVKGNPLEPNKEFFYQDLYKQPDELISFYRQFFWDNGEAKLTYPVDNYFDFDTYVMHDKDYWYVVFISTMTIDNILYQSDLTAKKEIEFKSELISDKYWHLSSGAYLGISDNIVYIMNDNHEYEKMIVDVDVNGNKVAADIHQITKINQTYYIYNNVTKEYLLDNDQINIDRYQAYWKYDEANREWIHRDSPVIEPVDISIIEDNNVYVYPVMYDVKVFQHVYEEIAYYNTEAEALAYIKKLKFTLKSQAEKYVDNLVDTERARYSIIREYNDIRKVYEYRIVYADTNINVFDDEEKDYFDTQLDAECKLDTILKAHKSRYNIVNELRNLYQYIYYDANTGQMLVEDAKYRKPVKANNYGTKLSNKYTLKWQRSSNQFLINRMYFIDSEGVNHFNNDDLIVASIDNVNFPFIFDTGTKWSFKPMSLGMLESSNVESNTNSAIMSIGNGNKKRIRGYYDVNVRYSVDAFMQHQYIKKARICID